MRLPHSVVILIEGRTEGGPVFFTGPAAYTLTLAIPFQVLTINISFLNPGGPPCFAVRQISTINRLCCPGG